RFPRARARARGVPGPLAVRLLVSRGEPLPRRRPADPPLGDADLSRAAVAGPAPDPRLAGDERRVRRAHGRDADRCRTAAGPSTGGSIERGLGARSLDRRGLVAADDRAAPRQALDAGTDRGQRPDRARTSLGRTRALP